MNTTAYPGITLGAGYGAMTEVAFGTAFTWSASGGSGQWSLGSNWVNGGAPLVGSGTAVSFDGTGTLAAVTVDQTYTVGSLLFSGSVAYTLSGNSLIMDNTGGAGHAVINSWSTVTQTVNSLVVTTAASDLDIVSSGGAALVLPNGIDNTAGKTITFNATNNGAIVIAGSHGLVNVGSISGTGSLSVNGGILNLTRGGSYGGGTTISGGELLVSYLYSETSATGTGSVTLSGGLLGGWGMIAGAVIAGSGPHTIYPSATLSPTSFGKLTVGSLTTNANTTLAFNLDLPENGCDRISVTTPSGLTLNGGTIQIANTGTGVYSLGYYGILQYSGAIAGAGAASLTLPAVANKIAYSLDITRDPGFVDLHRGFLGDANDDGLVNFADFVLLSNHFGQANAGWGGGDFNGDGITNFSDFVVLSNNFGGTIGANEAAMAGDAIAVPEPASLVLLGVGFLGVFGRRRTSPLS